MNTTYAIDSLRLRMAITDTERQIKAFKKLLRSTWTRPMDAEQREHLFLKYRATQLYVVRALGRGKYHLSKPPRRWAGDWNREEFHRKIAESAIERFGLEPRP